MCFDPVSMMLISAALSAGGSMIQQNEADANAVREVQARNEQLRLHNQKQDQLAAASRASFGEQLARTTPDVRQQAEADRGATVAAQIDAAPPQEVPLSGNAPKVIESEYAAKMRNALDDSRRKAAGSARLSSFGDQLFRNGLGFGEVGRDVGMNNNFAAGEAAILPHMQQYAALESQKPSSGLGEALKIAGTMAGMAGGSGMMPGAGMAGSGTGGLARIMQPKAGINPFTGAKDPWIGFRSVGGPIATLRS